MELWKRFTDYNRAYSSEMYNETMRAVEQLSAHSLVLLEQKPDEERRAILENAQGLTEKIIDVVEKEKPFVAAIALLMAVRVLERHVVTLAEGMRATKNE